MQPLALSHWRASGDPASTSGLQHSLHLLAAPPALVTLQWEGKCGDSVVLTYPTAENMGPRGMLIPWGWGKTALGGLWGH